VAKKSNSKSWLKSIVIFVFTPLAIWFIAFVLWFYWYDLTRLLGIAGDTPRPVSKALQNQEPGGGAEHERHPGPSETILPEERKQLEDILRERR
jgi:hypothetical protein